MRSLTLKFTLAFLLVGVITAVLVAALIGVQGRGEFDRFLLNRDQEILLDTLKAYYAENSTWDGVDQALTEDPFFTNHSHDVALLDEQGNVVFGDYDDLAKGELTNEVSIESGGQRVGTLLVEAEGLSNVGFLSPESEFLERTGRASITILAGSVALALVLGALLARTLTRPIRELTAASSAMAKGDFKQTVKVASNDEIGTLASSFNQMSSYVADSTRARKQLTADIAHDLRTPLTILRSFAEGLQDGTLEPSEENFATIHDEVVHLQHLVEDLRTLSLADAGELKLNLQPASLGKLIDRAVAAHSLEAKRKSLALNAKVDPSLPQISLDAERMAQVFNNLIANSLAHTEEGEIVISAHQENGYLHVEVSDTGVGISPENINQVFDRFYRKDEARQRNPAGSTGLGLAIARAIVDAHGGKISVVSKLGEGTRFQILLPINPQI
jgi:two-component system sensor histidine kinase BaeS